MSLSGWSTTAASNASVGAINWSEGQAPSTVNNSGRAMMADVAKVVDGTDVVSGWHVGANGLTLHDQSDSTKKVIFDISGQSAGTTKTIAMPITGGTLALTSTAAPTNASFVVTSSSGGLTSAQRVLTAGDNITITNSSTAGTVTIASPAVSRARFSYTQTSGTGGGNATESAWTKYPLSEDSDPDGIATVASNVITLAAGTYIARGWITIGITNATVVAYLRLRETTGGTTVGLGIAGGASDGGTDSSTIALPETAPFVTDGTKTYELQYWAFSSLATPTLGAAVSSGENEQYGALIIEKIAD